MALGIRVLAWVENSALFLLLIAAAVLGFVAVVWWHASGVSHRGLAPPD